VILEPFDQSLGDTSTGELSEDQIEAISLVGMGADEVHQPMLRGLEPRTKSSR
jgi:hypothetical protein